MDGMNAGEDDLKSSTVHNVSVNAICCGDVVDVNACGRDAVNKEVTNCEPQTGLEFDSKEAAYSFYREYARSVGFGITIKASRRSKRSGRFIDVKIACSRFGSKRESTTGVHPRSCPKTDCKASMHMKRRQDGIWVIYSFIKEHNHEICPDDFYAAIRGKNKQSGVLPCPKKGLQLALDERDIQIMLGYFTDMQDENPNFLYAIDLDHEKRLRNVLWVDAKARHDHGNFCDVVFFDNTYIVNEYRIPLFPIVGVNHHFQFMLLGCALIGDETPSTFVWIMQTWLRAMGGQTPRVIITDQDKSLKEAVALVFPDARHCFCLWHVMKKIPKKLGHVINQYENFMGKLNECIFKSWTEEQFEKRWWEMVDEFELREDEWVQSLYEDRKKWVPTCMMGTFFAGMSAIERAGSIASFFDKYLQRESTFKDFIEQYKAFLQDQYEEEAKADYETWQKQPTLKFSSPFLKQVSTTYTRAIFEKFQIEALGIDDCTMQKECEDEAIVTYRVDDPEQHQSFIVGWNERGLEVFCSCRSFEYRGFLCRHALLVLQMSGVSNLPSQYILRRWTNYAKIKQNENSISSLFHYRVQRFNDLCKQAIKLGEKGSLSEETYNIAFHALEEALKHCVGVNSSVKSVLEPNILPTHGLYGIEEEIHGNSLPKAKKRKMYRKRKEPHPEIMATRLQENCHQMELLNSRVQSLDDSYIPQQDLQGMELGCRGQTIDGYYGVQQTLQGVGQLSSISPIPDGYYGSQQVMQGLGQLSSISTRVGHYVTPNSMQGLGQLSFRTPALPACFDIQDNLQDMEESMDSAQFHGIAPKHLQDKSVSQ
ncbi:protein FAR1-RELATED SEQUENCE 2-like isoform X2 [Malania oleifera]|uniref:protein FAR1-RELATED SEQUENCE 2-like isoform X2 n=1 Tax=Malania oleifera TaxID=397392 RepID=UPI0025AE52AA|nr:protein FAR1-RELATED SEQUENCE 2-like isoform X2 [Malania oleifera]